MTAEAAAEQPVRKRRRDPQGHRAAILEAARDTFTERGYTRTTLREIARRADVTHGLISRQFSSKEQLFLAAVPGHRDLAYVAAGDPATLPERIARGFVERMETNAAQDPLVALIRSAATDAGTATDLLLAMHQRSAAVYRTILDPDPPADGDEVDIRVALLGSHLIGLAFSRYITRAEPLASMPPEELVDRLARTLRHILLD
ncbi:TetR family transcriptional regulator [Actinoplanes sp. NBRC 103695]|uniref:TetR/AcrR family transcriptional regulator n=1 Tax=Actinoplanes sp. NBRC 103695 TaxID=3032202 RepID=UPI0024A49DBE|nr:TetR family transcriptional regulator [Actinoplanes sp. NBRC 103695]GLY97232.1 TetR family transcriptional regulator [Actinoplanes sp. NBRC 103695]